MSWVPESHLVGEENRGFYYIMSNFQNERLAIMGQGLGESQRALELTIDHVKQRSAFGSPLWDKQAIRQRVALRQAEIDTGHELTYHAAWLIDQGEDATRQVSEVKAFVGEMVNRVLYDCVQFHGGMGFIAETAVERLYRDVRIASIGGGATEVMLDEIAQKAARPRPVPPLRPPPRPPGGARRAPGPSTASWTAGRRESGGWPWSPGSPPPAPPGHVGPEDRHPADEEDQERSKHHGRIDDQCANPVTLLTLEPEPTLGAVLTKSEIGGEGLAAAPRAATCAARPIMVRVDAVGSRLTCLRLSSEG